ncbi:methyltransferase [Hyphomonas sp.]|uniref:methyltransferase n=1 Tax=Hyphomonas sp. TaxID=87 RepID=UPI0039187151
MSLLDRLVAWKNRKIADPRFQAQAVRNPLLRPIARRAAARSFDLVAGFVYSQVLSAAVETGLIEAAAEAPVDIEAFAARSGLSVDGAECLLRAAAALRLLHRQQDGRYGLGEEGAALIGNAPVFAMIRHHKALYADLASITPLLTARRQDTELSRFWAYQADAGPDQAAPYSRLMAETQALVADEILHSHDFRRHDCVMDVGGGLGVFLERAGARHPGLALRLVDLPPVAALAKARLEGTQIGARLETFGIDFHTGPLPTGADLITLIRVLHDHDDGPALALLQQVRAALPRSGRLLVAEPMAGAAGAERMGDAYFGLYLWAMGRGRPRRADETASLLKQAGFRTVRTLPARNPLLISALLAS